MSDLMKPAADVMYVGNELLIAIFAALPEADRKTALALELAGADIALTLKWSAASVALRVGVLPGDTEPMLVFSADAERHADQRGIVDEIH